MSDVDPSLEGPPWEEDAPDADVVERDPDTDDMFGSPEPSGMREAEAAAAPAPAVEAKAAPKAAPPKTAAPADAGPAAHADDGSAYTVLARKYRPHTFEDLIGQEAMVRTLTNAFATGRIAHAFMLTGVRGVGKTTTARLLARALNNQTDEIDRPSLELTAHGRHDAAIMAGQHMDVVEMDAASHTGIDGIRDIIESAYDGDEALQLRKAAQEEARYQALSAKELAREIRRLEKAMQEHARNLEFEEAAAARDELFRLRRQAFGAAAHETPLPQE